MVEVERLKFRIPTWALSYIVNGDMSALEYEEVEKIDDFLKMLVGNYGNGIWDFGNIEEVSFAPKNDIDGYLGADVVDGTYVILEPAKIAPNKVMTHSGKVEGVLQYIIHPKGVNPIIRKDLMCLEMKTLSGTRVYGFKRAWIDSKLRVLCTGWDAAMWELINNWEDA